MPINVYSGLMGSGKSFECVTSVILPALCAGRRVVTNVDGINNDLCRAYCHDKYNISFDRLGNIIHCTNENVKDALFFPFGTDAQTFCQSGDIVCIDEAWRFWGTSQKLLENHAIFFREHRHYVHADTKVSCDLVLMVQDISDLHRTLKVVVELTFKTTKIKSLGLNKIYRVEMWEGYKLTAKSRISVENKKYDSAIFPLYSSYTGGEGKELQVDKRQNILKSKSLWVMIFGIIFIGFLGVYGAMRFFGGPSKKIDSAKTPSDSSAKSTATAIRDLPPFSETVRVGGSMAVGTRSYVVVVMPSGRLRLESSSVFYNSGSLAIGTLDGQRVTTWTGPVAGSERKPSLSDEVAKK